MKPDPERYEGWQRAPRGSRVGELEYGLMRRSNICWFSDGEAV